jgi:integrase/recombinase XerD
MHGVSLIRDLPITTDVFARLLEQFANWLQIVGMSATDVRRLPILIREFLYHLQSSQRVSLSDITLWAITDYYYHALKHRRQYSHPERKLAAQSLNGHLRALRLFVEWLRLSGAQKMPRLYLRSEKYRGSAHTVLTEKEIAQLYATASTVRREGKFAKTGIYAAMSLRDQALLAVFYGCALRRREGQCLNVADVDWQNGCLRVRHAKGSRQRMVPMSRKSRDAIAAYLREGRKRFVKDPAETALFLGLGGHRLHVERLFSLLRELVERTGRRSLLRKRIGLHTLRHSIATHLLARGMPIQQIKRFLGHVKLRSTEHYAHEGALY